MFDSIRPEYLRLQEELQLKFMYAPVDAKSIHLIEHLICKHLEGDFKVVVSLGFPESPGVLSVKFEFASPEEEVVFKLKYGNY